MTRPSKELIRSIPKAELHIHIEGSLEPELMFELAEKNRVELPYPSVDAVRAAYEFDDLQSFLDLYYQGAAVLVTEEDFRRLAHDYLVRAKADGVRHAEIFFDPQTHTARGIAFDVVMRGLTRALKDVERELGVTSRLIMCFLRDQSAQSAMATLESALPFRDHIIAVGLDSAEVGNPPSKFEAVFARAREEGFLTVAHAGEEGPPSYIWQALDILRVARIDHGVRCVEDAALVDRLVRERIPLTVCPLSNVKLRVFPTLAHHNLVELLDAGLCVTINSDDPSYFSGYIGANFEQVVEALDLNKHQVIQLAKNSFEASFLPPADRAARVDEIDRIAALPS